MSILNEHENNFIKMSKPIFFYLNHYLEKKLFIIKKGL